jgi:hypothetical protein
MKLPVPGDIYQHWKGQSYEVLLIGKLEENNEPAVIYRPVGQDNVWIREMKGWSDTIDVIEGEDIQRFKFVRNTKTA